MANKIIAVGSSEFIVGFRLAGIQTLEIKDSKEGFEQLLSNPDIGVIITSEETMEQLPAPFREIVEGRVKPVTVVVSEDSGSNEPLRKKIKKAIGVDLWKN